MPLNIKLIAQEALDKVASHEKVASDESTPAHRTEIGLALKSAADMIRNFNDDMPTNADLELICTAKVAALDPGLASVTPINASALGNKFRKMAREVREHGSQSEEDRLSKTAKIVNAAVALQHLTSLKRFA